MTIKQENSEQIQLLEAKIEQLTQELQNKDKQLEEAQERLKQQEKFASLGKNLAHIFHEIQNPLGLIALNNLASRYCLKNLSSAKSLEEQQPELSQLSDSCSKIETSLERIGKIIDLLMGKIKEDYSTLTECNLSEVISCSLKMTFHPFSLKNKWTIPVEIQEDYDLDLTQVQLHLLDFERAMCNLIENSLYSLRQKQNKNPQFKPKLLIVTKKLERGMKIVIEDNGEGIKTQHQTRIFEEFYTTKKSKGTGLGLFIVREIIEGKHGGKITLETSLNEFTRFTITIP